MRWTLAILFLSSLCAAQVQGNRPGIIDSALDGNEIIAGTAGVIPWPENIVSGQTVVLCFNTGSTSTFTLADTLSGGAWTTTSKTSTGGSNALDVWMAYKTFGASGPMTVTLTRATGTDFYYMTGARASTGYVIDGAVATNSVGPASGVGTITTSKTTTSNNDLLINCSGGSAFGTHFDTTGGTSATTATEQLGAENAAIPSIGLMMTSIVAAERRHRVTACSAGVCLLA